MPEYIIKRAEPATAVKVELVDYGDGIVLEANGEAVLAIMPTGKIERVYAVPPSLGFDLDDRGRINIA